MSMFFHHQNKVGPHGTVYQDPQHPQTVQAPEMSVSGAIPSLILLLGVLAVVFGKRRRGTP